MYDKLPKNLICKIYEYDLTYKSIYDKCILDLNKKRIDVYVLNYSLKLEKSIDKYLYKIHYINLIGGY